MSDASVTQKYLVGLPPAVQHAAGTRDDGEPSLSVAELIDLAAPTAAELAYACGKGWIDVAGAVAIISAKRAAGIAVHESEDRLAAGQSSIAQFQQGAAALHAPEVAAQSYWAYILMSWGWRVRSQLRKPSTLVEAVYTSLDSPFALADFAWIARRWGPKVGFLKSRRAAQDAAWRQYLAEEAPYYRDRGLFQRAQ